MLLRLQPADALWAVSKEGYSLFACLFWMCMCACVFTEGEVKWMYRHGDEEQRRTAISPNHLDVRDTVSAECLNDQTNTHAYTHICVCPPGPCGEVECISLLCPGRGGCLGRGVVWVKGACCSEEACSVQHTRSVRCCCHDGGHQPACHARLSHAHTYLYKVVGHTFLTTCSKHASAFKGSSHTHTRTNAHLRKTNTTRKLQ